MKEKEIVVNKEYPYLNNTKAPVQLLGLAPLYNPLCDHVSSQRLTMLSNHLPQAQLIVGCDFPRVYTGYENIIGQYEYDPSARDQDVQILAVIPKFIKNTGANTILSNPYYTIVYREAGPGDPSTKRVGYFQIEKDCMRTDNYGYEFKRMNLNLLNEGNLIPKDVKFLTSPAHDGNKYNLGVNLNIAYLDIPEVTEDAFVISETAAKKMASTGYGTRTFKILPNQIPVGLYSTESEYKFIPDVGEYVRDDGILCAIRTPSEASVVYDTTPENLHKVQYLHDKILYAPAGAEIVDIDVTINRKCKVKTPKELFAQLEKYRSAVDVYNLRVWETYRKAVSEGRKLTPAFRSLVTRCLASLIMDDQQVPGLNKRIPLTAKKNKEQIEFFYVTVKYKYNKPVARGFKQTSLSGDKGTISAINVLDK